MAAVVLAGFGVRELTRLPIDAVPDITNRQVQVTTVAPALGPEEVERQVTFPVETALAGGDATARGRHSIPSDIVRCRPRPTRRSRWERTRRSHGASLHTRGQTHVRRILRGGLWHGSAPTP